MNDQISIEQKKIQAGNPVIHLTDSCRIGNGIHQFSDTEKKAAIDTFEQALRHKKSCFFVPASGSGSRMFADLYAFLNAPADSDLREKTLTFVRRLPQFALFHELPGEWREKILTNSFKLEEIIRLLITSAGLNLGQAPKGLIPFHQYSDIIANPFHEHLLQGIEIADKTANFHFTINRAFEDDIADQIEELENIRETEFSVSFSEQHPETNSVAFDAKLQTVVDPNGQILTRPAGHGTLIHNLNEVDADLVFIRNIDNIQHRSKADTSIATRKALAGMLLTFQKQVHEVLTKIEAGGLFEQELKTLNDKYDLRLTDVELSKAEHAKTALNKPIRICGMVKNTGEPGGGPFWVSQGDRVNRQIIEKSQISDDPAQLQLAQTATHFNPVELVCGIRGFDGTKFDLLNFVDHEAYFIVHKTQDGKAIQYIEQPGLWNGGMANWLTLFYEIDEACFSPVKTVMDLLKSPHQDN